MAATAKLTIRLQPEDLEFVKRYAREHGLTVTSILNRYLRRLREESEDRPIHPEIERISGLVPADARAEDAYHEHLRDKHR